MFVTIISAIAIISFFNQFNSIAESNREMVRLQDPAYRAMKAAEARRRQPQPDLSPEWHKEVMGTARGNVRYYS